MNPRSLSLTILFLLSVTFSSAWNAAEARSSATDLIEAATQITNLFESLLEPFSRIGDSAERENLIDGLKDLNAKLFYVEQEKKRIITLLDKDPPDVQQVRSSAHFLINKIDEARSSLLELAPRLRIEDRSTADVAIEKLSDSVGGQKEFIYRLQLNDKEQIKTTLDNAKVAVNALKDAQTALADAIVALQRSKGQ